MSEPVTAEEMEAAIESLQDAKRDGQNRVTDDVFDELVRLLRSGAVAMCDRDTLNARIAELERELKEPRQ